jgi:hypothetical protein
MVGTEAGARAMQLLACKPGLSVEGGAVHMEQEGEVPEALPGMLRTLATLAADLEGAMRVGLDALAARRGHPLKGDTVEGHHEGLPWLARVASHGGEVRVDLVDGGPRHLSIVAPDAAAPLGVPVTLPNPILGRLVQIRAADPAAVAALLDEEATEAVLAVVRGHPGARVQDGEVFVPVGEVFDPEAFAAALDDALRLARALCTRC